MMYQPSNEYAICNTIHTQRAVLPLDNSSTSTTSHCPGWCDGVRSSTPAPVTPCVCERDCVCLDAYILPIIHTPLTHSAHTHGQSSIEHSYTYTAHARTQRYARSGSARSRSRPTLWGAQTGSRSSGMPDPSRTSVCVCLGRLRCPFPRVRVSALSKGGDGFRVCACIKYVCMCARAHTHTDTHNPHLVDVPALGAVGAVARAKPAAGAGGLPPVVPRGGVAQPVRMCVRGCWGLLVWSVRDRIEQRRKGKHKPSIEAYKPTSILISRHTHQQPTHRQSANLSQSSPKGQSLCKKMHPSPLKQ